MARAASPRSVNVCYNFYMVPKLNQKQLERLSDFCANLAVVFVASFILPIFFGVDKFDPRLVVLGLLLTIFTLWASLFLERK